MDGIDCSQLGAEKFLLLKALQGLKEERAGQAASLSVLEKTLPVRTCHCFLEPKVHLHGQF